MRSRNAVLCVTVALAVGAVQAEKAEGLVLWGLDTLHIPAEDGFDFVMHEKCTTVSYEPPYNCSNHFMVHYLSIPPRYSLTSYDGYGFRLGKVNLDSIREAPPYDTFKAKAIPVHIDSIGPDTLRRAIGNTYVLLTGPDPRYGDSYYAKIRIVDFIVFDSLRNVVDMVFLWAFNRNTRTDLATTGLDTFHLDQTPVMSLARGGGSRAVAVPRAGLVVGVGHGLTGAFVVARDGAGRGGVFDVRGRRVGQGEGSKFRVQSSRFKVEGVP